MPIVTPATLTVLGVVVGMLSRWSDAITPEEAMLSAQTAIKPANLRNAIPAPFPFLVAQKDAHIWDMHL
jgi:hypothetical protein